MPVHNLARTLIATLGTEAQVVTLTLDYLLSRNEQVSRGQIDKPLVKRLQYQALLSPFGRASQQEAIRLLHFLGEDALRQDISTHKQLSIRNLFEGA